MDGAIIVISSRSSSSCGQVRHSCSTPAAHAIGQAFAQHCRMLTSLSHSTAALFFFPLRCCCILRCRLWFLFVDEPGQCVERADRQSVVGHVVPRCRDHRCGCVRRRLAVPAVEQLSAGVQSDDDRILRQSLGTQTGQSIRSGSAAEHRQRVRRDGTADAAHSVSHAAAR